MINLFNNKYLNWKRFQDGDVIGQVTMEQLLKIA